MCIREDGSFNIEYDDGDKEFKVPVTRIRLEVAIVAKQIYFAVSVSTIISTSTSISYHIRSDDMRGHTVTWHERSVI